MSSLPSRPVESDRRAAQAVEVVGLLLLLAGVVGLVIVAFQIDDLLGWAAMSTTALLSGVAMTVRRA